MHVQDDENHKLTLTDGADEDDRHEIYVAFRIRHLIKKVFCFYILFSI